MVYLSSAVLVKVPSIKIHTVLDFGTIGQCVKNLCKTNFTPYFFHQIGKE
jgi:hypothetical protein